ncbi:molybdopterin-guanine dinucleotide biosynthesis protein B [Parvibaculum indicum]|uniref:molybdopterin-guanine dinucleotide biosynthesis protein B n=1 Tax=Parvibaculum indicum TaxID=562969 RepID=UPI00141E50B1|nr:molybdopterin-guanine dinucleotide biosynthesis protein B [Parvibaculum indicum]NIJ40653.1 molybdopterin-guanine dinucleotide biosynthesis protein B [Parvibaculum indicum]
MNIVGIVGWRNSGKTTLIARLIGIFSERGISVSTIKHAHHAFDIDHPGKDSFLHREAGAHEVLVASSRRWALMHEIGEGEEPALEEHLARLAPVDLVIVEGYKRHPHIKLEVRRDGQEAPALADGDEDIVAVIADFPLPDSAIPVLPLNDPPAVAHFIAEYFKLNV